MLELRLLGDVATDDDHAVGAVEVDGGRRRLGRAVRAPRPPSRPAEVSCGRVGRRRHTSRESNADAAVVGVEDLSDGLAHQVTRAQAQRPDRRGVHVGHPALAVDESELGGDLEQRMDASARAAERGHGFVLGAEEGGGGHSCRDGRHGAGFVHNARLVATPRSDIHRTGRLDAFLVVCPLSRRALEGPSEAAPGLLPGSRAR